MSSNNKFLFCLVSDLEKQRTKMFIKQATTATLESFDYFSTLVKKREFQRIPYMISTFLSL